MEGLGKTTNNQDSVFSWQKFEQPIACRKKLEALLRDVLFSYFYACDR